MTFCSHSAVLRLSAVSNTVILSSSTIYELYDMPFGTTYCPSNRSMSVSFTPTYKISDVIVMILLLLFFRLYYIRIILYCQAFSNGAKFGVSADERQTIIHLLFFADGYVPCKWLSLEYRYSTNHRADRNERHKRKKQTRIFAFAFSVMFISCICRACPLVSGTIASCRR